MEFLNPSELKAILSADGVLSRRIPDYEVRLPQLELLEHIAEAFNKSSIFVAEAGTGVGKSFAYLIPAIFWAVANTERVVISTATINLQHQLYEKDLPFLLKHLKSPAKVLLVKGRGNYICLRRFSEFIEERDLFIAETDNLDFLTKWVEKTETGDRAEYSESIRTDIWSRICSESDTCMGQHCPKREACFVMRLKKKAAQTQVLIVNHHLLFADIVSSLQAGGSEQYSVLPPWERLILDEAHHIEEAASSFFSEAFSRFFIIKNIRLLLNRRRGAWRGLLSKICTGESREEELTAFYERAEKLIALVEQLDRESDLALGEKKAMRLSSKKTALQLAGVLELMETLREELATIVHSVFKFIEGAGAEAKEEPSIWEASAIALKIEATLKTVGLFLKYSEYPDRILWIDRRRTQEGEAWFSYSDSPLDLGPLLRESLFKSAETIVALSATMTVNHSFSYWLQRTGLDMVEGRVFETASFPSPFPYKSQVLFAGPLHVPIPNTEDYPAFISYATLKLIQATKGSALVLFTSYKALEDCYSSISAELEADGITVFRQGDDERSRLLEHFKQNKKSVLFGTDSFWTGIDVPGPSLRLVLIARLPFKSPGDPVFEARAEAVEKKGESSFFKLSLPEAVMKFRQGFGRLMRGSADRGAVVVLDGRLLTKSYGRTFIRSLPESKQLFAPIDEIIEEIREQNF